MNDSIREQMNDLQQILYKLNALIAASGHELITMPVSENGVDVGALNLAEADYIKQALQIMDAIDMSDAEPISVRVEPDEPEND